MIILINTRKALLLFTVLALLAAAATFFTALKPGNVIVISSNITSEEKDSFIAMLEDLFSRRNDTILGGDSSGLKGFYNTSTRYGLWAYEHEMKRTKYLHLWADKQGIRFTGIDFDIVVNSLKKHGEGYRSYFLCSTSYDYAYVDEPHVTNRFRIGTYHSIDVIPTENGWVITREWYTDPFADSLELSDIRKEESREFILEGKSRDFSDLNTRRIRAVEYADRYCGAANPSGDYAYNKKYKNYNPLGGDCANFASQVLHEGGGFKKTYTWNYGKDGSRAWLNAHAFKGYLLYSGRASLIAYGSYEKVLKASFKLLPGDIVAYERKGKVKHVSVVTGADSKGYSLVNCHNTDRYRVPWDLGWSDKDIRFWLIRVHY
jgi:hypothetical protein